MKITRAQEEKADEVAVSTAVKTLLPFVKDPRTCVWIGSGFSLQVGYPSWVDLIRDLCAACGVPFPESMSSDALIDAAQRCRDVPNSPYWQLLGQYFNAADARLATSSRGLDRLIRLQLKVYLTTNFDYLLLRATEEFGADEHLRYPDLRATDLGKPTLRAVYLHGIGPESPVEAASDLILARDDFEDAYSPKEGQDSRLLEFLRAVLTENNLLFFACSLNDQWTRAALARLNTIRARLTTRHSKPRWVIVRAMTESETNNYVGALNSGDELPLVKHDNNTGVISVGYPDFSGQHGVLLEILRRLCEAKLSIQIGPSTEVPGPFPGSDLHHA